MPGADAIDGGPEAVQRLIERAETLATAESCSGGLIAHALTNVAGASKVFLGGVVAYSNEVKVKFLGVPESTLEQHGAVSEPVAAQMASGAREAFAADWAIGVTGIAGPGGGTTEKPVGLVYIGLAGEGVSEVQRHEFKGSRLDVKIFTAEAALKLLRGHVA